MKKNVLKFFLLISLLLPSFLAFSQTYNKQELEDLRAFLRQPSADAGIANASKLSLTAADTASWESSTAWVAKLYGMTWLEEDGVKYVQGMNWFSRKIAGTFSLPNCAKLKSVNVSTNQLTKIDVSANSLLETLTAGSNPITLLDVKNNPNLTSFTVSNTQLLTIDVSANPKLNDVNTSSTNIATLDFSRNPLLKMVTCTNSPQLVSIDFSTNLSLTQLNCGTSVNLRQLDLSNQGNLQYLYCNGCNISALDLRSNPNLLSLQCQGNEMETLILPNSTTLKTLYCHTNKLEEVVGLANLSALSDFRCYGNNISTLDISQNTAITTLHCYNNNLSTLDVSNNTAITSFYCYNNQLAEIKGLEKLVNMTFFHCYNNKLTDLTNLSTSKITNLQMKDNFLKLSTTPTRAKTPSGNISTYVFYPQATTNGGAILHTEAIDLSSEYSKTAGAATNTTTYTWFDISTGSETAITMTSTGNGVFQPTDAMKGKTLRCKMNNLSFNYNNGVTNATNFPFIYEVYIAGDETYVPEELEKIKAFLRQPSAVNGKCNANMLGIDTVAMDWNNNNLWIYSIDGIELTTLSGVKYISTITWSGKQLAGQLDFNNFSQLTTLDISNNKIVSANLSACPALQTVLCPNNVMKISTLPKIAITGTFEMAPQPKLLGGEIDHSTTVDLSSEFNVTINGNTTSTTYTWFDITDGNESPVTSLTDNNDGTFVIPLALEDKLLRCKMTNSAYWGSSEASQLTLIYEVKVKPYIEPTYATAEVEQLKAFLRQPAATFAQDQAYNFSKLGVSVADTATWDVSTAWISHLTGVNWVVDNNEKHIAEINWSLKEVAGSLVLKALPKLTILVAHTNDITGIDVENCAALEEIQAYNNLQMATLNAEGCTSLTKIYIQNGALTSLNIASCAALQHLQIFNNKLTTLDVSGKTNLLNIYAATNLLTAVNVNGCTSLERLDIAVNRLSTIDISTNTALIFLQCNDNKLTFATLPKKAIASYKFAPQADIQGPTIFYNVGVDLSAQNTVVFPSESPVTTVYTWFDVTSGTEVELTSGITNDGTGKFTLDKSLTGKDLRCKMTNTQFPGLTLIYNVSLDVSITEYDQNEVNELRAFFREESRIAGRSNAIHIGLSASDTATWETSAKWIVRLNGFLKWEEIGNVKRLTDVSIEAQGLGGKLLLPSCTELVNMWCYANQITALDVSNSTKLELLWCYNNKIPELNVDKCIKLKHIYCYNNLLTTLTLQKHPQLSVIQCQENQLVALDVTGCPIVWSLLCGANQLTNLDLTKNPLISELSIANNKLADIDLSKQPDLMFLTMNDNLFTSLDFSVHNKKLWHLFCQNNKLEQIKVTGLVIETINISNNKLKYSTIPFDFSRKNYIFAPQDTVDLGTKKWYEKVDISSEYMLDSDNSHTFFAWQELSGSSYINTTDVIVVDEEGIFKFKESAKGKRFRCTLTSNNMYRSALKMEYFVDIIDGVMPTFAITATAGANGTITPSGNISVNYEDNQTFIITPDAGYRVKEVLIDGINNEDAIESGSYTFVNVTANHTISAEFEQSIFTITATADANGTIAPDGATTLTYGDSQEYTITANEGYKIKSVLVDDVAETAAVGASSYSYTFSNVTANHTISAEFEQITYTITATAGANGTIAPSGVTTVSYGSNQAYTITANNDYLIKDVKVDGVAESAAVGKTTYNYTFNNVKANHTISATFEIANPELTGITVNNQPQTISSAMDYMAACGEQSVSMTLTAVGEVKVNGAAYTNGSPISLTGDKTVITITVTAGSNTATYTLTVAKALGSTTPLYIERWGATIAIVNNPVNNGGYTFDQIRWYRDGSSAVVSTDAYVVGNISTHYADVHAVETGAWHHTCRTKATPAPVQIVVYPNPVLSAQTLNVKLPEGLNEVNIDVYDINGKLVKQHPRVTTTLTAPTGTGIYVLKIQLPDGSITTEKIVVK